MLICSSEHALKKCKHVNTNQLKDLNYVSLFQSSTVQAIKATLTQHHIQWQALKVVLVSISCCPRAWCNTDRHRCRVVTLLGIGGWPILGQDSIGMGHMTAGSLCLVIHALHFFLLQSLSCCCWTGSSQEDRARFCAHTGLHSRHKPNPLWYLQEVNSVEAIKTAVACNLGVAFVSQLAVEKEVAAGQLHALTVKDIPLTRSLRCVANPARYQSRAVRAFIDLMFDPSTYLPADAPTPLEEEVPPKPCTPPPPSQSYWHEPKGSMGSSMQARHVLCSRLILSFSFCPQPAV